MAITVKIEEKQNKEISYPCLMKSIESNLVVLFEAPSRGVVVSPGKGWLIGQYKDCWVPAYTSIWESSPPITLSNS